MPQVSSRSPVLTRSLLGILAVLALHLAWPWYGCKTGSSNLSRHDKVWRKKETASIFLRTPFKSEKLLPYQQILSHIPMASVGSHVPSQNHQQGSVLTMIWYHKYQVVNYSNQNTIENPCLHCVFYEHLKLFFMWVLHICC